MVRDDSGVFGKAYQVAVVLQQFLGFIAEAIIQRVDEVEADLPRLSTQIAVADLSSLSYRRACSRYVILLSNLQIMIDKLARIA